MCEVEVTRMAIGHPHHPYRYAEESGDPISSPAAFIAALCLMLMMFLVVVLLWAPWSGAGDTAGTSPQTQPAQLQPVSPQGIQIVPSAPQNPGSADGR
jgi:hypothetical protein